MRMPLSGTGHDAAAVASSADGQSNQGPMVAPVSAAENRAPGPIDDSPDAAQGRLILSTAFVRVGPDNRLTVERRAGAPIVLRDVQMGAKDYCGTRVDAGRGGERYCGSYADVTAARPGGLPARDPAEPVPSNTAGR